MKTFPSMALALLLIGAGSFVLPAASQDEATGARKVVSKSLPSYPSIAAESAVRGWKWEKSDHETTERVEVRFNP